MQKREKVSDTLHGVIVHVELQINEKGSETVVVLLFNEIKYIHTTNTSSEK